MFKIKLIENNKNINYVSNSFDLNETLFNIIQKELLKISSNNKILKRDVGSHFARRVRIPVSLVKEVVKTLHKEGKLKYTKKYYQFCNGDEHEQL